MQEVEEKKSQKQRVNEELEAIRVDVTEQDKIAFKREVRPISTTVLSNYLNGKAANVDTALKMLLFFRERIKARDKIISG